MARVGRSSVAVLDSMYVAVLICGVSFGWRWHTRNPGNKKAPFRSGRALKKPGEIFVQRISPAAHRANCFAQPPWDFSVPGWQPLVLPEDIPDVGTFIAEGREGRKPQ